VSEDLLRTILATLGRIEESQERIKQLLINSAVPPYSQAQAQSEGWVWDYKLGAYRAVTQQSNPGTSNAENRAE
jgi:hypothetical protein